MNKSVRENCIPKCIVVSLEKNPKKDDFFKPDYQNTASRNYFRNIAFVVLCNHQYFIRVFIIEK